MPNTWDSIVRWGTWDYLSLVYATWDDLLLDVQQPELPPPPIPHTWLIPDLAGLSLAGAYQAGILAGYRKFNIVAYRQSWMLTPDFWFPLVAPAIGYVAQTTTPGSGYLLDPEHKSTDVTPKQGSFFTSLPTPGVADQFGDPGEEVPTNGTLCFVFAVPDDHVTPNDWQDAGHDPATNEVVWWLYDFDLDQGALPNGLLADMIYNGLPRTPVDVGGADWSGVPQDPLAAPRFTAPPAAQPDDLIQYVPQFERQSYEIRAVLRVVAGELARIEAAQGALIQQYFPASADALLGRWESILGLPVEATDADGNPVDLGLRRTLVLAYMRRLRTEGTGLDWIDAMNALAGTAWDYQEHDPSDPSSPPPSTLAVNIPQVLAHAGWQFVRDVTPAHLAINQGYTGGWLVGIGLLDITLL